MTAILEQLAVLHHLMAQNLLAGLDVISINARSFASAQALTYGTVDQGDVVAKGLELTRGDSFPSETSVHHHWHGTLGPGDVPFQLVVVVPVAGTDDPLVELCPRCEVHAADARYDGLCIHCAVDDS